MTLVFRDDINCQPVWSLWMTLVFRDDINCQPVWRQTLWTSPRLVNFSWQFYWVFYAFMKTTPVLMWQLWFCVVMCLRVRGKVSQFDTMGIELMWCKNVDIRPHLQMLLHKVYCYIFVGTQCNADALYYEYCLLLFRLLWWHLRSWIRPSLAPHKIQIVCVYLAVISCRRR